MKILTILNRWRLQGARIPCESGRGVFRRLSIPKVDVDDSRKT